MDLISQRIRRAPYLVLEPESPLATCTRPVLGVIIGFQAGGTGGAAAQAAVDRAELSPSRGRQRPSCCRRRCRCRRTSSRDPLLASLTAWCCCVSCVLRHASPTPPPPAFLPPFIAMAPAAFITPVAAAATRSSASAFAAGAHVSGRPTLAGGAPAVAAAGGRGRAARLAMKVTIEEAPLPNSMRGVTIHVSADEVALCYNKVRTGWAGLVMWLGGGEVRSLGWGVAGVCGWGGWWGRGGGDGRTRGRARRVDERAGWDSPCHNRGCRARGRCSWPEGRLTVASAAGCAGCSCCGWNAAHYRMVPLFVAQCHGLLQRLCRG